jgi:GT2 family glycosyltransferase
MLNYNGLKYLKRTIPPILKLDYPNYEFIIVDNGSTDGSIEFIKKFKKIRLIQSPRLREKNFACNYAIKRAKGEFILLIDNDLLITENSLLKSLISESKIHKDLGSLSLSFYNEGENFFKDYGGFFNYLFIKDRKKVLLNKYKKFNSIEIGFPQGLGFLIKKELWLKIGGYDEHLKFGGDDNDLGIRLLLMGYKNYLYSQTIQKHLGLPERQDNKKYSLKSKEMFYSQLYTIVKDFKFFNMIITLIGHSGFMFLKLTKRAIFRLHYSPFLAFFQGYYLFLKNLPYNLKKRKEIQSKRVIKEDIFLKIKPPKI